MHIHLNMLHQYGSLVLTFIPETRNACSGEIDIQPSSNVNCDLISSLQRGQGPSNKKLLASNQII